MKKTSILALKKNLTDAEKRKLAAERRNQAEIKAISSQTTLHDSFGFLNNSAASKIDLVGKYGSSLKAQAYEILGNANDAYYDDSEFEATAHEVKLAVKDTERINAIQDDKEEKRNLQRLKNQRVDDDSAADEALLLMYDRLQKKRLRKGNPYLDLEADDAVESESDNNDSESLDELDSLAKPDNNFNIPLAKKQKRLTKHAELQAMKAEQKAVELERKEFTEQYVQQMQELYRTFGKRRRLGSRPVKKQLKILQDEISEDSVGNPVVSEYVDSESKFVLLSVCKETRSFILERIQSKQKEPLDSEIRPAKEIMSDDLLLIMAQDLEHDIAYYSDKEMSKEQFQNAERAVLQLGNAALRRDVRYQEDVNNFYIIHEFYLDYEDYLKRRKKRAGQHGD